jgi:tRNA threonylcarbamoyladenosine biosynthesis protein TsaE
MTGVITKSEEETKKLAQKLWQSRFRQPKQGRPMIFALYGDFGSGKTTFVKGLAKAMGITDVVRSPSYTIINEYGNLIHADLWRIDDAQELENIGLDAYLKPENTIAVEWAEKAKVFLDDADAEVIHLEFEHIDTNRRRITVTEQLERADARIVGFAP